MGITGLLPLLEHATRPCSLSELRSGTVAVDTYCWLHKGASACAVQLARGEETNIYVDYCLKYVKLLLSYNIRPIMVFDGRRLPAKSSTEQKRRESRNKAKQRAAELLRMGKTEEARSYLKQSINITPDMALAVIKACRKLNVDCIVAPYECDAQLAYFNIKGIADVVITEDSDLVLFGCSKVFFKLDLRGMGYLVEADKLPQVMKLSPDRYTFDKFRYMCILSGCDYIASLRGIGLKKAMSFVKMTDESNPERFLNKIPRYLNMLHLEITDEYKRNFMIADATFRHQTVFDPFKKKLVPLTDPAVTGTNPEYCINAGEIFDHEVGYQLALGNLHPATLKPLDNWAPSEKECPSTSIWSDCYRKHVSKSMNVAQFKGFFKPKKTIKKDDGDDEQIKIDEDNKLTEELEFYKRDKPSTSEAITSPESPEKVRLSPVLTTNPFRIEKKLSKFRRTTTSTQVVVKSRYFSSKSGKSEEEPEPTEESESRCSELSDVENKQNNGNTENLEGKEPTVELGKNKNTKGSFTEVTRISESESVTEVELDVSQQVTDEDSGLKRKHKGSCRSLGLKRIKKQMSIQEFFGKANEK